MKKIFGYWKEKSRREIYRQMGYPVDDIFKNPEEESPYPEPKANDEPWQGQGDFIARLLKIQSYAHKTYFRGFSSCRICKKINGSIEYEYKGHIWPEGYLHYIEEHNIEPTEDVKTWVIKNS